MNIRKPRVPRILIGIALAAWVISAVSLAIQGSETRQQTHVAEHRHPSDTSSAVTPSRSSSGGIRAGAMLVNRPSQFRDERLTPRRRAVAVRDARASGLVFWEVRRSDGRDYWGIATKWQVSTQLRLAVASSGG